MNVLIVGSGKGSWQVRGLQLGQAIDARTRTSPRDGDLEWADVVVCVKRALFQWADTIHAFKKPIVWDALDFWDQPEQNELTEAESRELFREHIDRYQPTLVIGATESMAAAARGVCLPHHHWPGLVPAPVRNQVKTVAYQGVPRYLGRWRAVVDEACQKRGWAFVINPKDIRAADLLVALRDGDHDGWMCREWKSGVKLVNAMAAGVPIITQPSAAFKELRPHGHVVDSFDDLDHAFDCWSDLSVRAMVKTGLAYQAFGITQIAARYRAMLERVTAKVAV